jgi:hypothetical protein
VTGAIDPLSAMPRCSTLHLRRASYWTLALRRGRRRVSFRTGASSGSDRKEGDRAECDRLLLAAIVYSNNASSGTASHLAAAARSVNKATRSGE